MAVHHGSPTYRESATYCRYSWLNKNATRGQPPTAFLVASHLLSLPSPGARGHRLLARNVPTAAAAIPHRGMIGRSSQGRDRIKHPVRADRALAGGSTSA
jgi:hypothetical protein